MCFRFAFLTITLWADADIVGRCISYWYNYTNIWIYLHLPTTWVPEMRICPHTTQYMFINKICICRQYMHLPTTWVPENANLKYIYWVVCRQIRYQKLFGVSWKGSHQRNMFLSLHLAFLTTSTSMPAIPSYMALGLMDVTYVNCQRMTSSAFQTHP